MFFPKKCLVFCLFFLVGLSSSVAMAYQPASVTWEEFVKSCDAVVWARLVAWEGEHFDKQTYTFRVEKAYMGEAPEEVVIDFVAEGRGPSFGPRELSAEGFLFLKKVDGKWQPAMADRSWWQHVWVMGPDYGTSVSVRLGDFIHDFPEALTGLKKTKEIVEILKDRKEHKYEVEVYLVDEVEAWLIEELKE